MTVIDQRILEAMQCLSASLSDLTKAVKSLQVEADALHQTSVNLCLGGLSKETAKQVLDQLDRIKRRDA